MALSDIPFLLNLEDSPPYYGTEMFPNRMFRRTHPRLHEPLDMHTLGLIARMGAQGHHLTAAKHGGGVIKKPLDSKNDFEVHLDVGLFQPEELTVKLSNGSILIEGKHEEREDEHGHVFRHFVRRYELPKGYNPDALVSKLSTDGVLTVVLPKPKIADDKIERIIPIHQTGPSDLFVKTVNGSSGNANTANNNHGNSSVEKSSGDK